MEKKVYYSKIDWWIWAIPVFSLAVVMVSTIGVSLSVTVPIGVALLALEGVAFFGSSRYVIDDGDLIVCLYLRPKRYPISKIKSVKYMHGILSAPALSTERLAIRFTDRGILKSYLPLEISPKDRDGFVAQLLAINPDIAVSHEKRFGGADNRR